MLLAAGFVQRERYERVRRQQQGVKEAEDEGVCHAMVARG